MYKILCGLNKEKNIFIALNKAVFSKNYSLRMAKISF